MHTLTYKTRLMLRLCFLFLLAALFPAASVAQRDGGTLRQLPPDSLVRGDGPLSVSDSVSPSSGLSFFPIAAPGTEGCAPWAMPYGGGWRLHEGFNAQLSLGVTAAFGKHAPRGVGFSQGAAFVYAVPLTQRLGVAAGVYASNVDWGASHQTEAGLTALVAYRVNPSVSLYGYVAKSFYPRSDARLGGCFPMYYPGAGDRIGAMAEFKLGEKAAIQVGVECTSEPRRVPGGWDALPRPAGRIVRQGEGLVR